ncbi:MAG: eukaryotic integral membrane protein-domain-containing protein [Monoraphidium minutum]|nr:MAG: eukaryotic integral membrane protein-domain-containing protein [Monoraphidium minutum]
MNAPGSYGATGPAKFTRLSKVLSMALVALFGAVLIYPPSLQYLALIPGRTLPCVWNLLTAPFVTTNAGELLFSVASLLLLARVIEPIYGSTEFLRLLLVAALSASAATFVGSYVAYLASPDKDGSILYAHFTGFHGIVGGMVVAVKQVTAGQDIKLAGMLRLPGRYLPTLYVVAAAAVAVGVGQARALAFLLVGTYCSWVYLRFFQWQPETTLRGDPSEDFKFSSFFPDALSGPIDAAGGVFSTVCCLAHSPDAVAASAAAGAAAAEARQLLGGGGDDKDANRRRERGAKALEERLMAGKAGGGGGGGGAAGAAPDPVDRMEAGDSSS